MPRKQRCWYCRTLTWNPRRPLDWSRALSRKVIVRDATSSGTTRSCTRCVWRKKGCCRPTCHLLAAPFPANYRSPAGFWHGFAARARVLIVNTELVAPEDRPHSIEDLVDPKWKDRVGVAKPLFGTTATHASVLFATWGETRAREFFRQLKENSRVLSGNKQVAVAVGRGELAFGLTDTDDAIIEREEGQPVEIVFPDQWDGEMGTLFIPNTVAIIKGSPHPEEARRLVDYLLSSEVEDAAGRRTQRPGSHQSARVGSLAGDHG